MVNKLKGKNILVTGGTGFIGSHLIEELIAQKANPIATYLYLDPRSYFAVKNLEKYTTLANVDITDYRKVFDLITKFQVDYIFHLAAQPIVEIAYYNPLETIYTNIIGTVNILESARNYPHIHALVVASSDKAYGKLAKTKYSENDPLKGDHPYEVSKSSADLICQSYYKTYQIPVAISRFGNIYGEGDLNFSRIIPGIAKSLIKQQTLELRSNGQYVRDYVYVKDVVSGYLLMASNIDKSKGHAFNFGSQDTHSVINLIKLIESILDKKVDYKILNNAKNEIPYQSLNFNKSKKLLGWKPKWDMTQTIKQIIDYYSQIV